MTKYPTGRMLSGFGNLRGPSPNTQFNIVIDLIVQSLPLFAVSVLKDGINNENGLNSLLTLFIAKVARHKNLPFIAHHQSIEDLTRGDSPTPDIGIHLDINDNEDPPPKITVLEGKRLTTSLGPKRRKEYVIGHEENGKHIPCGGIERFKFAIHGGKHSHAGMVGYLQDGTPDIWREKINSWISDLCSQPFDPAWSEREKLTPQMANGRITECSSVVCREDSELHLTHLWINLVP